MPYWDSQLEWELLHLLLNSCELAHPLEEVGLVLRSNRVLEDAVADEVVHQK